MLVDSVNKLAFKDDWYSNGLRDEELFFDSSPTDCAFSTTAPSSRKLLIACIVGDEFCSGDYDSWHVVGYHIG